MINSRSGNAANFLKYTDGEVQKRTSIARFQHCLNIFISGYDAEHHAPHTQRGLK